MGFGLWALLALLLGWPGASARAASIQALFDEGTRAYQAGDYARAALAFGEAAARQPASGSLQNLGNAQWQRGETGPAILAWERALWLDAFNRPARNNLRFARKVAQLEAPELSWYEVVSTWLPIDWWAWIAGASFWLALGMVLLPGIFRRRKAAWHQAVAALGLMVFLLSLPAHLGVYARSRLGFVVERDAPLRLTPTQAAQTLTLLSPGESARVQRAHGRYLLVRTTRGQGWIQEGQFSLICPTRRDY